MKIDVDRIRAVGCGTAAILVGICGTVLGTVDKNSDLQFYSIVFLFVSIAASVCVYLLWGASLTQCPKCMMRKVKSFSRVTTQPTDYCPGRGVKTLKCKNCGWSEKSSYSVSKY